MPDAIGIIGVIPARYGSRRFPGKPLARIAGKPMIQHVYERALRSRLLSDVIVATDDRRILSVVEGFGGRALMTSRDHPTGSDRVAEVASRVEGAFYVNIQGDEPLIDPGAIDKCASLLREGHAMSTLMVRITTWDDVFDPNIVKVVTSSEGKAIYFSRSPIPYVPGDVRSQAKASPDGYFRHVGIYGYTAEVLDSLHGAGQCWLEVAESLEQLRALWLGIPIAVAEVESAGPCVDLPEDIAKVEAIIGMDGKTNG